MRGVEHLPRELQRPLGRLARLLRGWAVFDGLARWVLVVACLIAVSVVVDRWAEPALAVRIVLLTTSAATAAWLGWRRIISPLAAPMPARSLALIIERAAPELGDRLITAVETPAHPSSHALLSHTVDEATRRMQGVRIDRFLRTRPTEGRAALAAMAAFLCVAWGMFQPAIASVWLQRAVWLQEGRYPRRTRLLVEGFTNGEQKAAAGRDVTLAVRAEGATPTRIALEIRSPGERSRHLLTQVGEQEFRFVLRSVIDPLSIQLIGGDARTDWLQITPVAPPVVQAAAVAAVFPAYTGLPPRTIPLAGAAASLPVGTEATLRLQFSKPLQSLAVRTGEQEILFQLAPPTEAAYSWRVKADLALKITARDEDGIESTEPFPIEVAAIPDRPPIFEKAEFQDVGPAVSTFAVLPVNIVVKDDYGVERLRFALKRTQPAGETIYFPIVFNRTDPRELKLAAALDLTPLGLKAGERFEVHLEAADVPSWDGPADLGVALSLASRETRSTAAAFGTASAEEVLSRLASRELNFRQRWEQTIRELRDGRAELRQDRSEPASANEKLRLTDFDQVLRKSRGDAVDLAAGFRRIVAEIHNNRITNSALAERLTDGVAVPLGRIAVQRFPACEAEWRSLIEAAGEPKYPAKRIAALALVDQLLREAEAVLAAMLKLESFQEMADSLRSLRDEQERLLQRTRDERKRRILELLK